MKYFYLYVIMLFCFIVFMGYYNTLTRNNYNILKEPFTNNKENKDINKKKGEKEIIILLGDSILKNNSYAKSGQSIEEIIYAQNKNSYCYAVDYSLIDDIQSQLNAIPTYLNTTDTFIFLSVGGNDILSHYEKENGNTNDNKNKNNNQILHRIFSSYKQVIHRIQSKMNKSKIVLLDIYYPEPNNGKYKEYNNIIMTWNNMIYTYANNPKNNIYDVLKISNIMTEKDDFLHGIEPSTKGGEKIANAIIKTK